MNPDKIRIVLNILFLAGVVAAGIVYFTVDDKNVFYYVSYVTIFFKLVEFFIRFTNK